MSNPVRRNVANVFGDGHIRLIEEDVPSLAPGTIMIDVKASLVSPGTEVGGWRNLAAKKRHPDRDAKPRRFGYSNTGRVMAVGDGVTRFKPGDRVACVGAGYALHTETAVVPHNLTVLLPDEVTWVQGAYAMLMATALHALRRAGLGFGETYAVAGLGLVGQLAARLHVLAGNYVIGWDLIPFRTQTALKSGIHAAANVGTDDHIGMTREFTRGYGLDGGLIAFGGEAGDAVKGLVKCMKRCPDTHPSGVIVVVGGASFDYQDHETTGLTNIDIRRASRTGPGYHDDAWEVGSPYPPVFMRWTTETNLALCMRLLAEGKVDVDTLTTHEIPLGNVDELTQQALENPDGMLGVVFVRGD